MKLSNMKLKLSIKEKYNKNIDIYNSHIRIYPYELGDSEKLESLLSVYDPIYYTVIPVGYQYDKKKKVLKIPRGISIKMLEEEFIDCNIKFMNKHDPIEKVMIKLNTKPRDKKQKEAIGFLLGKNDYNNTKKYSRLMLTLDTGVGKTYCTIAAASYKKYKTAIIVPDKTLLNQWIDKICQYTNLSKQDIYIVSGKKTIKDILKKPEKLYRYKLFMISIRTLTTFGDKHGWKKISKAFKNMNIGLKVFDECHKEMNAIIKIDLNTNTKRTIYLTATAGRSNMQENYIFNRVFYKTPNFNYTRGVNYINTLIVKYKSKPYQHEIVGMKSKLGLNTNKCIEYVIEGRNKPLFLSVINKVINTIKSDKNTGKIVILVGKKNACNIVYDYLVENHSDLGSIGIYNSDVSKEDKKKVIEMDVIVSTSKSLGTGADIPNLRYLIMCEPYSSQITSFQVMGRLREIEGNQYYFEIIDTGIKACAHQFDKRKSNVQNKSKTFKIIDIV